MISIFGKTFSGRDVNIVGGRVIIDGRDITDDVSPDGKFPRVMEIRILEGEPVNIHTDASVNCSNVKGDVRAGGSVNCDDVGGSVSAGGSVNCDDVAGSVTAGGSICHG